MPPAQGPERSPGEGGGVGMIGKSYSIVILFACSVSCTWNSAFASRFSICGSLRSLISFQLGSELVYLCPSSNPFLEFGGPSWLFDLVIFLNLNVAINLVLDSVIFSTP